MTFVARNYKDNDIKLQTQDLIDNLQDSSPTGGVNIIAQQVGANMERINNAAYSLLTPYRSISVSNVGDNAGTVFSAPLLPGESVTFAATLNNYFIGFDCDATGTEFLIIYIQ